MERKGPYPCPREYMWWVVRQTARDIPMLPLALILAFVACSFGKLLGDSGLERLARVAGSISRALCAHRVLLLV